MQMERTFWNLAGKRDAKGREEAIVRFRDDRLGGFLGKLRLRLVDLRAQVGKRLIRVHIHVELNGGGDMTLGRNRRDFLHAVEAAQLRFERACDQPDTSSGERPFWFAET